MEDKGKILIIDDNEDVLFALNLLLEPYMEKIKVTTQPSRIKHFMETFSPDVILLDMNFCRDAISGNEGFEYLEQILSIDPKAVVVFMTAYADTEKAVRAIKAGATDFISKPWEKEKLLATLSSAIKLSKSNKEINRLREQVSAMGNESPISDFIGESPAVRKLKDTIYRLSETDANILILGENGTGKDMVARMVKSLSPRAGESFITIDLGSIPEQLFESELFGYEKGAFTDARKSKPGRMEMASGGTLFLDEIGNLSLPMQAKLLTALEKRYITRLGGVEHTPIDIRLISATNSNLQDMIDEGKFRQDLLYRINTIELPEDIQQEVQKRNLQHQQGRKKQTHEIFMAGKCERTSAHNRKSCDIERQQLTAYRRLYFRTYCQGTEKPAGRGTEPRGFGKKGDRKSHKGNERELHYGCRAFRYKQIRTLQKNRQTTTLIHQVWEDSISTY